MKDFDVCIIGSGAGGGPVALTLAEAGYSVVVLEKGPWFTTQDFYKDELACCRRSVYTPKLHDEQHVIEEQDDNGGWQATATSESGWDFWNGNCVGGSSNFMSGFFHRLKPVDFHQLSEFGSIDGANRVDWPISYEDLAPYYDKVERVVGVSGQYKPHKNIEPRKGDFPYPPTAEHAIASWIDTACDELGYHSLRVPRAILSKPQGARRSCEYSGYCGSYGCASDAKGSSRVALLDRAVATGRCEIRPYSKVTRLISDAKGKISKLEYTNAKDDNKEHDKKYLDARIYVVACQAIETSRLLLHSTGPAFPDGLANNSGQVGKNLLFSAGGSGSGDFDFSDLTEDKLNQLKQMGPFVNRALDDWYTINDAKFGKQPVKGGIVEFLLAHPNPTGKANGLKWDDGQLLWGKPYKRKLENWFRTDRSLKFEVFNDWLPTDDCFVSLDSSIKDRWATPVAKVRIGYHEHDLKIGSYLTDKGEQVLKQMGAVRINSSVSGSPPANLVAGGCRFGNNVKTSVLDADCRAHEVENLFVTDGSFMPTGGSVPYTWTIYANAFRVAEKIKTL
jgi:choline dehydrogenase-like flavoprotein